MMKVRRSLLPLAVMAVSCAMSPLAIAQQGAGAPNVSPQAQLFMELQQLRSDMAELRGMVEEQQHSLELMRQELESRTMEGAVADDQTSMAPAADTPSTPSVPTFTAPVSPQQQPSGDTPVAQPGDPAKEKLYYDAAYGFIEQKDLDKAQKAFTAFLVRYPNGQYAGNAQYWLGEIHLSQGDLQTARSAFAKVVQSYPQHSKVPDALYKLGSIQLSLNDKVKAKALFQQLVSSYPSSTSATLARQELQKL